MVEHEVTEYLRSNFCGQFTVPEVYKALRDKVPFDTLRATVLRSAKLVDCTSRPQKFKLDLRMSDGMPLAAAASGYNDACDEMDCNFDFFYAEFTLYGLQEAVARQLAERLMVGPISHSPHQWLDLYLEEESAMNYVTDETLDDVEYFKTLIILYGFTVDVAEAYAKRIVSSGSPYHVHCIQWISKLVEIDFLQCPVDGACAATASGDVEADAGAASAVVQRFVSINLPAEDSVGSLSTKIRENERVLSALASGKRQYAHGTTRQMGIKLEGPIGEPQGRQYLDFSHGDGFYLGTNLDQTISKAKIASSGGSSSIMVYGLSLNELDAKCGGKYVDFYRMRDDVTLEGTVYRTSADEGRRNLWEDTIHYFRTGRTEFKRFKRLTAGVGYIRGPIADSCREGQNFGWRNVRPIVGWDTGAEQLCIKTGADQGAGREHFTACSPRLIGRAMLNAFSHE